MTDQFERNPAFNIFGVVTGTASETQFPTGTALAVRFKADPTNIGDFFIGDWISNVATYPLNAGDDTLFVDCHDLNQFVYRASSGTSDRLHFWILR